VFSGLSPALGARFCKFRPGRWWRVKQFGDERSATEVLSFSIVYNFDGISRIFQQKISEPPLNIAGNQIFYGRLQLVGQLPHFLKLSFPVVFVCCAFGKMLKQTFQNSPKLS